MNTIHENGIRFPVAEYLELVHSARTMEEKIRTLYIQTRGTYTAHEVHAVVGGLLTSVRRSLTNLKNDGFLTKSLRAVKDGNYEVKNHVYYLPLTDSQ